MSETKTGPLRSGRAERTAAVATQCTLTITNNSNIDSKQGNFIFYVPNTNEMVNVDTPVVFAGTVSGPIKFDWNYADHWTYAGGVINSPSGIPWSFSNQATNEFPNANATLD